MNLEQFRAFSHALQVNLEADSRVLGLVFLGSSAEQGRLPDAYSDHDFFRDYAQGTARRFSPKP